MNWKRTDLLYGASSWPTRKNWLEKQAQKEAWGESALWWTWPKVMTGFQGSNSVISVGLCFSTTFFTTRLPPIQGIHLTPWSWQIPTLTKSFLSIESAEEDTEVLTSYPATALHSYSSFLPNHCLMSDPEIRSTSILTFENTFSSTVILFKPRLWDQSLLIFKSLAFRIGYSSEHP